jgi:hypothetical protein
MENGVSSKAFKIAEVFKLYHMELQKTIELDTPNIYLYYKNKDSGKVQLIPIDDAGSFSDPVLNVNQDKLRQPIPRQQTVGDVESNTFVRDTVKDSLFNNANSL